MKKCLALTLAVLFCLLMVCTGCNTEPEKPIDTYPSDTSVSPSSSTYDETTVMTTAATTETTATTDATEATKEIIYTPITDNKVSDDYLPDPTEAPKPSKPVRPTHPSVPSDPDATGDEATAPSEPVTQPTTAKPQWKPDKKYKYVAFTFDDGPHYELTYMFVDKLREYGGTATFYVVGNRIYGEQAKAMKYAYDNGNEIGIHGYTHEYYYDSCSESRFKSELSKTAKLIKDITGESPLTMRPIGGGITSSRVKSSGYVVINWNVDSNDWRYTGRYSDYAKKQNVNTIANNVLRATDEGDIILFHEIYYNSYDAFCKVADDLYKRGYRFVTVSQLLGLDDSHRGKLYYNAY